MIGVSRGVHIIGKIREKVFHCCSKGRGDSVAGLVVFAPGMVLLDGVKQGDHSFISGLNKFIISYKAMQKSSLAPTPSISDALHNFGRPDREFQALLYYVPFLPVNLTLFHKAEEGGIYKCWGNKDKTQWSAQRNKNGFTRNAYQEELRTCP